MSYLYTLGSALMLLLGSAGVFMATNQEIKIRDALLMVIAAGLFAIAGELA